jgi:potassium transporter
MRVLHTASHEQGQIYMPVVNWLLAIGTLGAVITFGSSDALAGAYGIAVSMLMAITTVLAGMVDFTLGCWRLYAPVFNRTSSYGAEYEYPVINPSPDSSTLDPWPLGTLVAGALLARRCNGVISGALA